MQALPWGPEFRTWKSWLGLGSPDKDLDVLISKSWIQDLFARPANHAWNPTLMPINVGYHAVNRRSPRCSPIILTSSSPFLRPYPVSRWGNGEILWWICKLWNCYWIFFQEILAGKYYHLPEGAFYMVSNYLSLVLNIFSNNFSSGWQRWRGCGEGREAACRSCCQLRSKLPQFKAPGYLTPFNWGGFEPSSITRQ